ncbi:MAG TPA: sterol desaturase family protein [Pseudomonadales bacterium]|nr:sterol desaturase family protein [Pseudomonadales bacterium]
MAQARVQSSSFRLLRAPVDAIIVMCTTKANYWAEFVVDAALVVVLCMAGWRLEKGYVPGICLAFLLGLLLYTLIEYIFHRWLFHTGLPWFADGHQKHHEDPLGYDSLPFFLPALVSLGLSGVYMAVLPVGYALLVAAAVTFGYMTYGLSHFTIHRVRFRQPWIQGWAAAHHIHHYHPDRNFGVTTPLWDILLGTRYVRRSTTRANPA